MNPKELFLWKRDKVKQRKSPYDITADVTHLLQVRDLSNVVPVVYAVSPKGDRWVRTLLSLKFYEMIYQNMSSSPLSLASGEILSWSQGPYIHSVLSERDQQVFNERGKQTSQVSQKGEFTIFMRKKTHFECNEDRNNRI